MEPAAANAFFPGEADELLDNKMYSLSESQDFTQDLVRHMINSPILQCQE